MIGASTANCRCKHGEPRRIFHRGTLLSCRRRNHPVRGEPSQDNVAVSLRMGTDPRCQFLARLERPNPRDLPAARRTVPKVRVLAEPKKGAMGWDMRRGLDACRGK